jgi:hypothetical protein
MINQEPTPPAARVIIIDDSDRDKGAVLSTLPKKSMDDPFDVKVSFMDRQCVCLSASMLVLQIS